MNNEAVWIIGGVALLYVLGKTGPNAALQAQLTSNSLQANTTVANANAIANAVNAAANALSNLSD